MNGRELFGKLPDGRTVFRYEIRNQTGMMARILTWGATLMEWSTPDRQGDMRDIVLGYPDLSAYVNSLEPLGAVAGRVVGRIPGGRIEIAGKEYGLVLNDSPHHLNGGLAGLGKRLWDVVHYDGRELRLRYVSADGEEGYPGTLDIEAVYRLSDRDELSISFEAETDGATPLSVSPRVFFNLGGEDRLHVEDHRLFLFASDVLPSKACLQFSGAPAPRTPHAHDFPRGGTLDEVIRTRSCRRGDLYKVNRTRAEDLVPAARLTHPASGRVVHVATTQPCVQVCTGAEWRDTHAGKCGKPYPPHSGVCILSRGYPNGGRNNPLGDLLLTPGARYRHQTVFAAGLCPEGEAAPAPTP